MKLSATLQGLQRLSGLRLNLQQGIANWQIRGVAIAALGLVSSCVIAPPPGSPPPTPGWNGNESSAYRSGHSDGSHDKRQGRNYNPYRGQPGTPQLREAYTRGYNAGYRNANDNPWSERRAYQLGQTYGRRDKQAGYPMNPNRQADDVPRAVRDNFRTGYREGWNSTRTDRPTRPPRPTPY